jgi:hypothetical protein
MARTIEEIEAARAARRKLVAEATAVQLVVDLEAIDSAEEKYGPENVTTLRVPYVEGLPVVLAARTPTPAEVKRYRDRVRERPGKAPPDHVAANEELGTTCVVYPSREVLARIAEARPTVVGQLGVMAIELGMGEAERRGKD